ncbi:MAG: 7-cyano-7-deazaguanine synthase [Elusimicrobia bacterium]|nr:7-cyano-7-deazaguanine synthase [Elusimicrobiota bacterium]
MADKDTCLLVSGGVESAALIRWALEQGGRVVPVYVQGGHAWERAELRALRRLLRAMRGPRLEPLRLLRVPVAPLYRRASWSLSGRRVPSARSRDERVYLPGRNVLLLAEAAVYCAERGISRLALGMLATNPFPDATPAFLRAMERALSLGLARPLAILTPFGRLRKSDVVARTRGVPWELTFSCLAPRGDRMCGRCNKCAERAAALSKARQ